MIARRDFTYAEWSSLLQLYRRENAALATDQGRRFKELGITEEMIGETGLSAAGKRLVEHELLLERRNRLQR